MAAWKAPSAAAVRAERLKRQHISDPVPTVRGYPELARALQPLSTGAYDRPGSPPRMVHRTRFDDRLAADRLRSKRELVKGRFQGGGVGYVLADELELYANCFCKPLARASEVQQRVFEAILAAGPVTPLQLREETGLLAKQVMPALHRLQTAFLVYEDQLDDDWERPWYDFASEWPEVEISESLRGPCTEEVLCRFVHALVFATHEQVRDWSRLPSRAVRSVLDSLVASGALEVAVIEHLGEGYVAADPEPLPDDSPPAGVFVLNRGDYLVRSHASELRRRFADREVLQYLLIDGELLGAICGHWGFKPYDVEDVALDLPARERTTRRDEILSAVTAAYPEPRHHVQRYAGRRL